MQIPANTPSGERPVRMSYVGRDYDCAVIGGYWRSDNGDRG
jgi:hypothetical protein